MNERDNQTSKRRLLKLADYLDTLSAERFNFAEFADGNLKHCGTTGCAVGHMTQMKEFKRLGVKQDMYGRVEKVPTHDDPTPVHGGFEVAMHVLKMTYEETDIFCPNGTYGEVQSPGMYAAPKSVAKAIRKFVKLYRS